MKPYGRPFRRKRAAALAGRPLCVFCGLPILHPVEGTLDHDPPVSVAPRGPWRLRPAHKTCNASHGGRMGAAAAGARHAARKVWPGAIHLD